ncbi:hypothetical protein BDD12DRAFT_828431 [Trichophaea hybrida]|nr:hypothetical protein BDD12DRAFT_828431 [Trichophaea hybrida]
MRLLLSIYPAATPRLPLILNRVFPAILDFSRLFLLLLLHLQSLSICRHPPHSVSPSHHHPILNTPHTTASATSSSPGIVAIHQNSLSIHMCVALAAG